MTIADARPDAPPPAPGLDRDTELLSGVLEETIALLGGEALRSVELRGAAARVRAGEPGAEAELAALAAR